MTVTAVIFYIFACTVVASGLFVVLARNPVHSVLWLILTFISSAGLFVLMGAEFVAMILIIVYVGAVAVLFLFVVMMLDVDFAELKDGLAKHMPIGLLIGVVLVMELMLVIGAWTFADAAPELRAAAAPAPDDVQNTVALGQLIYTR
ncbi:MAG: NADH-quinone oxidoreductase subunit J, partial [Pseudomonadota bacterium]